MKKKLSRVHLMTLCGLAGREMIAAYKSLEREPESKFWQGEVEHLKDLCDTLQEAKEAVEPRMKLPGDKRRGRPPRASAVA